MATMGSWRELLLLYLTLVNIESTLELGSWDDLTYFFDTGSGNYSTNSTYQTNLNTLLSTLSSRTDVYGFYSSSFGDNPDKVYAIVLCRGDVELDTCRSCINNSTTKLPQLLPNYKGAIGWYEKCMLRYSDKSMNGSVVTDPKQLLSSGKNASSMNQFNWALGSLLGGLRVQAANGGALRKFATDHRSFDPDSPDIYGLMQCTPDLSEKDCNDCLQNATELIPQSVALTGWRILAPSCTIRYELNLFYNDTSPATSAPPAGTLAPPPPSANVTTTQVEDQISIVEFLQYDFETISIATDNFSDGNKLGRGGFGAVYKGRLLNGWEIAVKRLAKESRQGEIEFKNEVRLLAKLQHRNLVRLLGFCSERTERLLIYEFVPKLSLDKFIFDQNRRELLGWDRLYKIIRDISRGLLYLHEESRVRIIHRDLKANNVLLDDDMNPKISDFGLARLFVVDETHRSTSRIAGTRGYMAPEYLVHGRFSVKSDVFSFGVLVLEILSGRENNSIHNGDDEQDLLSHAWKSWRDGTAQDLIDPALRANSGSMQEMITCIHIGLLCVQENIAERPTMASVVNMLSNSSLSFREPSKPGFFLHSDGYNSELPLLQEHSPKLAVSDHSINKVSITELYPR